MMKKVMCAVLAMVLLVVLIACGGGSGDVRNNSSGGSSSSGSSDGRSGASTPQPQESTPPGDASQSIVGRWKLASLSHQGDYYESGEFLAQEGDDMIDDSFILFYSIWEFQPDGHFVLDFMDFFLYSYGHAADNERYQEPYIPEYYVEGRWEIEDQDQPNSIIYDLRLSSEHLGYDLPAHLEHYRIELDKNTGNRLTVVVESGGEIISNIFEREMPASEQQTIVGIWAWDSLNQNGEIYRRGEQKTIDAGFGYEGTGFMLFAPDGRVSRGYYDRLSGGATWKELGRDGDGSFLYEVSAQFGFDINLTPQYTADYFLINSDGDLIFQSNNDTVFITYKRLW